MTVQTIAIISPGELGSAVGGVLKEHGLNAVACLSGRSALTRERALAAGFRDVPTMEVLLEEADLVLSIMPPAFAVDKAREVAAAMKATGHRPAYVDCNAISPDSSRRAGKFITEAGGVYIDGGIIVGPPPWEGRVPVFYVSGEETDLMTQLDGKGISVRVVGSEVGPRIGPQDVLRRTQKRDPSRCKTAVLIAAEAMGLTEEFEKEMLGSREGPLPPEIESGTRRLPSVAARYVGEMEEIAAAFSSVGVTPKFHQGAYDVYRLLAETPYASETPDTIDGGRTLKKAAQTYANHLPMG